tara:strand:- start:27415 stop:27831 length:417 start_codon:yes stop_codon:yes gene_type:complete
MSVRERRYAVVLVANLAIYGVYFAEALSQAGLADPQLDTGRLLSTIVSLIVVIIVGNIIVAILAPSDADAPADERDRLIGMRSDQIAGFVASLGGSAGLVLAIMGFEVFWIANAVLAGLVAAEIIRSVVGIAGYRMGM